MTVEYFQHTPPLPLFVVYLLVAVLSGAFIGATGIGGVLLVPLLLLMDVPIHVANPAVLASLFFAGLVAIPSNWHAIPRRTTATVALATIPGAFCGTVLFPLIPSVVTSTLMATLAVVSGIRAIRGSWKAARSMQNHQAERSSATTELASSQPPPGAITESASARLHPGGNARAQLVGNKLASGLGIAVGFLSILTSTGGPFVAIPLFFHFQPDLQPALVVAMAQSLCVPVAVCSTAVAAWTATVDLGLGCSIGVAMAVGVPPGVRISHHVRPARLKLAIGILLLGIGVSALVKVVLVHMLDAGPGRAPTRLSLPSLRHVEAGQARHE
jgi:uncharacterized membrane protein YfcA